MAAVHYTNLLIVVTIGLLAPLALGFFPRFRLPAIVLELVLGIVIGPSGLGWAEPDLPVSILALIGLAFLLFLSGLEIDVERLRGPVLKLTTIGFADYEFDRISEIAAAAQSAGFGFGEQGTAAGRFYDLPQSPMAPPIQISSNEPR